MISRLTAAILVIALALLSTQQANGSEEFKGKIGRTLAESEEWWPEPVTPPEDAPNVLFWLVDDMGFGHSSPYGGLVPTPRWTAYDARRFGVQMSGDVKMTLQERAYTSPIWYTP